MLVQLEQLKEAEDKLEKVFRWLETQTLDLGRSLLLHLVESETKARLHSVKLEINKVVERNRIKNDGD